MALGEDDAADFYLNIVIGLSLKWLDPEEMAVFFASYQHAARAAAYDTLVWLTLENWLYDQERTQRPALASLRKAHARSFMQARDARRAAYREQRNAQGFEQAAYRWASVLEIEPPRLSPKAGKLAAMLAYRQKGASTQAVISHLKDVLMAGFHFSDFHLEGQRGRGVSGPLKDFLDRVLRREVRHQDSLLTRNDWFFSDADKAGGGRLGDRHESARDAGDAAYIRACFGPCIYPRSAMKILENDLCTADHAYCRLWIAKAQPPAHLKLKEAALVNRQMRRQTATNRAYYQKFRLAMAAATRKLTAALKTVLASYMAPLPVASRAGRLDVRKAYRLDLLGETTVFTRPGDEVENALAVTILLDASASRLPYQEQIAAQSHVLVESLTNVQIPTRIMAFHSLRGYTVLQMLKDYGDRDLGGIFRYTAAGWNRDGLALLAAGRLMAGEADETKRILLVMTDAHPDDSTRMPPEAGSIFDRGYGGFEGIKSTKSAVKQLKAGGIRVGAVYTGPNLYVENVRAIYGADYVRVQKISQLADGISSLLQAILRTMRN
jgi:hypothetical protein